MTAPVTYSQTGLAAYLTGYTGHSVSRQAVHSRLMRGRIAPGTACPPDAPIRWTQAEVDAIALAWDVAPPHLGGQRKGQRVPGSRRDLAERRRAGEA